MICFTKKCRAIRNLERQKKLLDLPSTYKNNEWVNETIYLIDKYIGNSEFPQQLKDIEIAVAGYYDSFGRVFPLTPHQMRAKHDQAKRIIDRAISIIQKEGIKKESRFDILLEHIDLFLIVLIFGIGIGSIWHPFDKYWIMFVDWLNALNG